MNQISKIEAAEQMIGELNNGKYYFLTTCGLYRESEWKVELIQFLVDNKLV